MNKYNVLIEITFMIVEATVIINKNKMNSLYIVRLYHNGKKAGNYITLKINIKLSHFSNNLKRINLAVIAIIEAI